MPPAVALAAKASARDRIGLIVISGRVSAILLMTDYFAVLGELRRPWLDPEALKGKFLNLSGTLHPDRSHQVTDQKKSTTERFVELNAAYNCLRDPKQRLFHLLTLEHGSRPEQIQRIGSEPVKLFNEVSHICRKVDSFLAEKAKTTSVLLRAQMIVQATELTDVLSAMRNTLNARHAALMEQIKKLNLAWESAPSVGTSTRINFLPCGRLEQLYSDLSYVSRWSAQIEERFLQLAM